MICICSAPRRKLLQPPCRINELSGRAQKPCTEKISRYYSKKQKCLKERATHCSPDFLALPGQPHESCSQVDTHLSEPWHSRKRLWCWVEGISKKRQSGTQTWVPSPTSIRFRGALPPAFHFVLTMHKQFRSPEWKVSPLCRLLLLDDLISPGKPLAKILLVWPPEPGCLRAVLPLGKLWRESLSALERNRVWDVAAGSASASQELADPFVFLSQY